MVFLLRVRAQSGVKRLVFESAAASWRDLQLQVSDVCGVPTSQLLLSRTPLHQADYIDVPDSTSLAQLGLHNGDLLFLAGEAASKPSRPAAASASSAASSSLSASASVTPGMTPHIPVHTLTPDCKHGPRGACPFCLGVKPGEAAREVACTHGPGTHCIHCSAYVKSGSKETATWLCNHPDTVFCPKCIPPAPVSSSASAGGGLKVDKVPFSRWLEEKKALCRFKHGPAVTCPFCATPPFPSFAGKLNCDRGHAPYPAASCLNCAPPNANLRVQPYRHVDSISVESRLLAPFYSHWLHSGKGAERAAILIGRYVPEPAETNNPGAVRAEVHALYEPPQEAIKGGVRFLKDDKERAVHEVARRCGMETVGWVLNVERREGGDKYGGKILLSGPEVQQAARFQLRYANEAGYSRFVTLILEQSAKVEPVAFQVADMAVALEKEQAFTPASDPFFLATTQPTRTRMTPTIVYKDRPLRGGESFLPDELLVKLIVSSPREGQRLSLFHHAEYASAAASDVVLKAWLQQYKDEEYEEKLSDFNLLVNLVRIIGESIVMQVCDAVRERRKLSPDVRSQLDAELLEKQLL